MEQILIDFLKKQIKELEFKITHYSRNQLYESPVYKEYKASLMHLNELLKEVKTVKSYGGFSNLYHLAKEGSKGQKLF